jgi:hypothetical protein
VAEDIGESNKIGAREPAVGIAINLRLSLDLMYRLLIFLVIGLFGIQKLPAVRQPTSTVRMVIYV